MNDRDDAMLKNAVARGAQKKPIMANVPKLPQTKPRADLTVQFDINFGNSIGNASDCGDYLPFRYMGTSPQLTKYNQANSRRVLYECCRGDWR